MIFSLNSLWSIDLGGNAYDISTDSLINADNNLIVVGYSNSSDIFGGPLTESSAGDIYLLEISPEGNCIK